MENQISTLQQVSDKQLLCYLDNLGLTSKLTHGEKDTYLQICKAFALNPFKREIHVSKYGETMSIITGYEVYIKRAERSGQLDGWQIVTEGKTEDNSLKAIITIHRKDRKIPFIHEVYYSEYVQKAPTTGLPNKFWQKAHTMIKKVAMSQGFRLCFSDELGGMPYTAEELPEEKIEEAKFIVIPTREELTKKYENLLDSAIGLMSGEEIESKKKTKSGKYYTDWNEETFTKAIEALTKKMEGLKNATGNSNNA
jgi:phage recombination protein Bet